MDGHEIARFQWIEAWNTGLERLDHWHQEIFHQCNDLLDLRASGAAGFRIDSRVDALVVSCLDHFRFEEEMMRRTAFPRIDHHEREHSKLEAALLTLTDQIRKAAGHMPAERQLLGTLRSIIIDAMVRLDMDFKSHLSHHLEQSAVCDLTGSGACGLQPGDWTAPGDRG